MVDLFTFAANEATAGSIFYLGDIFGNVGTVLTGSGPALLSVMFKVFNTTVLALGSLIVTYTAVLSVILTAHEGEFLGKKFGNFWIPLRTVMGIAALVPTATGYSYLQIGMMWFILQGIGAADTLWTTVVNYVQSGGSTAPISATAAAESQASTLAVKMKLQQLFQGLACQAAAKAKNSTGYFCGQENNQDPFCGETDAEMLSVTGKQVSSGVYSMGPAGKCGSLTLGDAKQSAVYQVILPALGAIATELVTADYEYNVFYNATDLTPATPPWVTQYCSDNNIASCDHNGLASYPPPSATSPSDTTVTKLYYPYAIYPSAGDFITTTAVLYASLFTSAGSSITPQNVTSEIIANGWIFAGSYFYMFAQANKSALAAVPTINVTIPTSVSDAGTSTPVILHVATSLVNEMESQTSNAAASSTGSTGVSGSIGSCSLGGMSIPGANSLCNALLESWITNLSGGTQGNSLSQNPMIKAQQMGDTIVNIVELIYVIYVAFSLLLMPAGIIVLGNGAPVFPTVLQNLIIAPMFFFMTLFLGLGLTLAVYTPMIPYLLYTFGVIGWLTATIETMIAAPLVAIGFLYPEGQSSDMWGKAEHAIWLVLNIFLRPSLMIFGMMSGMLMSYVVIMIINASFMGVVGMVGSTSSILETIMFMIMYTSLFVTSLNKCFALIHIIPDKVMRWIGHGETFGEGGGGLEDIKGAVSGGAEKAGSAAVSGMTGAGKVAQARGEKEKTNQKQAKETTGTEIKEEKKL